MTALNVDQIIAKDDMKPHKVSVPEWGKDAYVCVLPMSGVQLDQFEQQRKSPNIRGKLIGWCLCDDSGKHLNPSPEQVQKLGNKNGAAVTRITDEILTISSMGDEELEELEKN